MARVNITRQVKTLTGWKNISLDRDGRGRIKWGPGAGRYILEWYEGARRRRQAGGTTPAEALEAQRRKRLELDARQSNVELPVLNEEEDTFPLQTSLANFLKDIRAFRKPLT